MTQFEILTGIDGSTITRNVVGIDAGGVVFGVRAFAYGA